MAYTLDIPTYSDERGSLSVVEKITPFEIKRVYYIYNAVGRRGGHRHKTNTQALICLNGSCIISNNDGTTKQDFVLDTPAKMLILETKDWHQMHSFSQGAILLVMASQYYSVDDYIDEPYP